MQKFMSLIRKLTLILPVSLAFFAVSGWAQTAAIEGVVKGPDGKLLQGAVMKIDRLDVKGNYQVKTDKRGHYFYGGLPGGSYKVAVLIETSDRQIEVLILNHHENAVVFSFGNIETCFLDFDWSLVQFEVFGTIPRHRISTPDVVGRPNLNPWRQWRTRVSRSECESALYPVDPKTL